ncbi:radical SAM protein [uncultured Psychrobacter sp.]|uniref:radical SAM protein n=1 Tax=uncultured Psychrobacter sp. TaxID=259303 RepID=UPI00259878C7|nr:radical SAM protein [uncultured Psychrobacter sp.]
MILHPETNLKAEILTRGVVFSSKAIDLAREQKAKGQNLVYNAPKGFTQGRPQELFLTGEDGYTTVTSCVSAHNHTSPVIVDVSDEGELICSIDGGSLSNNVDVSFVPEPEYYRKVLRSGESTKKYISACGYDELNIIPWKGCLISSVCKFCGVNNVAIKNPNDALHSAHFNKNKNLWSQVKDTYFENLLESIDYALESECYSEHMHVILISGNLSNKQLDLQTDIYADIAAKVNEKVKVKSTEGIIAVISPPHDMKKLHLLKEAGVEIVVFNLEVGNDPWFTKYCPGKSELGRDFFIERLKYAVDVFGYGKSWTNFVLGLEPIDKLLELCEKLAEFGIVSSANILHLDEGNQLDCLPPSKDDVIHFFYELSNINRKYGFDAFYCSKALRTSLSNEFQDGRYTL